MNIYAQHGYAKTDKIEVGLREGLLSGVILSPRDEHPDRMEAYINDLRDEFGDQVTILFDPQFYATTVLSARDRYLPEYQYYQPSLTRKRFSSASDVHQYANDTLTYQAGLGLERIISPSTLFEDFRDPWSQIAILMAEESIAAHNGLTDAPPLLLSLVMDENALRNIDALNEFLDIISILDVAGFYLIVRRNDPKYPAHFDERSLGNLIYFVYVLAEVNNFEVVCGYTDLVGLILQAVGAHATGSGWYNTLRQFSFRRFEPQTGGRPPLDRYTSGPLLNSILVVPELETIYDIGQIPLVLSDTSYGHVMDSGSPSDSPWPLSTACLHHWEVLARLSSQVTSRKSVVENLTDLEYKIQQARVVYGILEKGGVVFGSSTGPRDLVYWERAIESFRTDARI